MKNINMTFHRSKYQILALTLLLLSVIGVGTTMAFLFTETEAVVNKFIPGIVTTAVEETFVNNIKENVMIKNTGNITAYIRAAIVINWVDSGGNISGQSPQSGEDYSIIFPEGPDWFVQDGFYYFKNPVNPDEVTSVLVSSIEPLTTKDGYTLLVEILGSGIQSMPSEAVEEVWPVTVDITGKLVKIPEGGGL